jgi:dipeptidyl aminopeptidase/acylaminoacyl peptidase
VPSAGGAPELLLDADGDARAPSWSPDGRRLAFSLTRGGRTHVWVAPLATLVPRRVTRAAAADLRPDWSPDGARLAFTRSRGGRTRIWVVRLAGGGPAQPVAGTDGDLDADWSLVTATLAPGPEQLLPDLDQQPPAGLVVIARGRRFHLGFDSAVDSIGRGPLRIRGLRPGDRRLMRADQVIERAGGGTVVLPAVGTLLYQTHPPHRHWHFQQFETYELRRAEDHALVGRDRKSGFCLIDRYGRASARVANVRPPRFIDNCGAGQRALRRVEQGSSPGYVDRYPAFFHGQDIDITDAPAGVYVLVHRANPTRRVRESSYGNNAASVRLRLSWPAGRSAPPRVSVLRRCPDTERCPAA